MEKRELWFGISVLSLLFLTALLAPSRGIGLLCAIVLGLFVSTLVIVHVTSRYRHH